MPTGVQPGTIAADGTSQETLLVAGPPARFAFGELMGLPQVTLQAKSVADQVATWLSDMRGQGIARRALSA